MSGEETASVEVFRTTDYGKAVLLIAELKASGFLCELLGFHRGIGSSGLFRPEASLFPNHMPFRIVVTESQAAEVREYVEAVLRKWESK